MRGQAFKISLRDWLNIKVTGALTSVNMATPVILSYFIILVMKLMQEKRIIDRIWLTLCITEFSDFDFSLMNPLDGHHSADSL